jgi:hypothetical protein
VHQPDEPLGSMNERLRAYSPRPVPRTPTDRADPPPPPPRSLGLRVLGWVLLLGSVGLVSCQSLFAL